jgi:hypothetical protein
MASAMLGGCAKPDVKSVETGYFEKLGLQMENYKNPNALQEGGAACTAYAVAISGGGHRSANFALGVFRGLADLDAKLEGRSLVDEVDLLSTVSGGAFFGGGLRHRMLQNPATSVAELVHQSEFEEELRRAYGWPVFFRSVTNPAVWGPARDRGNMLELRLRKHLFDDNPPTIDQGFPGAHLRDEDILGPPFFLAQASTKMLQATFPMTWETLEEHHVVGYDVENQPPACLLKHRACPKRSTLTELTGSAAYGSVPLTVAIKASAAFPVGLPVTTLYSSYDTNHPYLWLSDGGESDNLGIRSATDYLDGTTCNGDTCPNQVLILIDAYTGHDSPYWRKLGGGMVSDVAKSTLKRLDGARTRAVSSTIPALRSRGVHVVHLAIPTGSECTHDCRPRAEKTGTKLKITKRRQQVMIEAGEEAVDLEREELLAIGRMGCPASEPPP